MIPDEFPPLIYEVSNISKLFWREFTLAFQVHDLFEKGDRFPGFPSFTAEIFHRLYYEPLPEKLEISPPESEWAEKLHDEFADLIGFDNLIQECEGNQLAAGLATKEFCEKVLNSLPQPRYQLQDPQKLRELVKRLKNSQEHPQHTLNQFSKLNHQEKKKMNELTQKVGNNVEELIEELQSLGKETIQIAREYANELDESQIRQTLREAIIETEQKLEEASQWLEMMGLSWGKNEGVEQTVSPVEKMKLVQKIEKNEKLRQIAKIAGRLKNIASRKRRIKSDDVFGELTTIELGNNLARLLPSELQKLAEPTLFPLFALGYYEQSLLQYKIVGKEKMSKGPVVVCLDSSGSMKGLPDTWAKAIAAVLGQIAYNDKRHFQVIHFDTKVCRVDDFPPKHHNYNKLLSSMLSFYSGGGTDWKIALTKALKCVENDKSLSKADIVMITDGECDVDKGFVDKLKQQKSQRELNILSILIGNRSEKNLKKISDRIWVIKDLNTEADTKIEELFLI